MSLSAPHPLGLDKHSRSAWRERQGSGSKLKKGRKTKGGRPLENARPSLSQGGERSIFSIPGSAKTSVIQITLWTYSVVISSRICSKVAGPMPDTSMISSIWANRPLA
jgi:hypothetical protein